MAKLLKNKEIEELINGFLAGKWNAEKLPYWLYSKLADSFLRAAEIGWGAEFGEGIAPELELLLKENVFYFAAGKTASEMTAFQQIYNEAKNRDEFVKAAIKADALYNKHWYATEYNVTERLSQSGREWLGIEQNIETFPKLKFIAVNDENTRDSHRVLNGTVRPVNDDFWKSYYPPLDWNCRCRVEQVQEEVKTTKVPKDKPKVEEQFKERVTDSKKIWRENHPYFTEMTETQKKQAKEFIKRKMK